MTSGTGVSVSFFGGIPGISGGIFGPGDIGGVTEGVHPPPPPPPPPPPGPGVLFTIIRILLIVSVLTPS